MTLSPCSISSIFSRVAPERTFFRSVSLREVTGVIEFIISCARIRVSLSQDSISFSSNSLLISLTVTRRCVSPRSMTSVALRARCTSPLSLLNVTRRFSPGLRFTKSFSKSPLILPSCDTWFKTSSPSSRRAAELRSRTNPCSSSTRIPVSTESMMHS